MVIDLSAAADFTKGRLSDPERLFFDIKDSRLAKECPRTFAIGDKVLKSVRLGQFNAATVRIVFDLESSDYDFKIFSLEDPARLVIDILAKDPPVEKAGEKKIEKEPEKGTDTKKPEIKKPDTKKPEIKTEAAFIQRRIVIDPGHGGHDPGAVGPTGLYEKDVVLDIAMKMRDMIRKEFPHYDVILTRDTDVFIPLPERAKIANSNSADLFLSVHANASPNRQARGIETYLLNYTDDEEALSVAARENAISLKKMKEVQDELGFIKASLARELKRDDSVKLAGYVQAAMVSTMKQRYPKINDLKVKQAMFYVLVDARMASALAEVSFISNPEEEKLLSGDAYKQELARSLVSGVNAYFNSLPRQHIASHAPHQKISYNKDTQAGKGFKTRPVKYVRKSR